MEEVTGNEGGPIPYEQAVQWINNYRNSVPAGSTTAHLFGINVINQVLQQPGCMGIRIYYAKEDPKGDTKLIVFGVDAKGDGLTNYIAEFSFPCPPYCGRP